MAEQSNDRSRLGQSLMVHSDDTARVFGKNAQSMNIEAGRAVSETVRTTLGPNGMDKMLVDSTGGVVVTNDGVTILDEMDVEHPAAAMIVEVAESQDDEVGDGTTTAVIIAGELLRRAKTLLEQELHPQTIVRGYQDAAVYATEHLAANAADIDASDRDMLAAIARTAISGKNPPSGQAKLVDLAVQAVQAVTEDGQAHVDNLTIETVPGGTISDSSFVEGVAIDKDPVHPNMPERVENARIALVDTAIEVKETDTDLEVTVTDPTQLTEIRSQEERHLEEMIDSIAAAGTNVVFCEKGIDDVAQHLLAKEGILAVRRVKGSDYPNEATTIDHLARATGATVVSDLRELEEHQLGYAGLVRKREIGDEELLFLENCDDPRSVALLLRGGTENIVKGAERTVTTAIDVVAQAIENPKIVPGGGATEVDLALVLRDYADGVAGREQFAIEAFADALEAVPRTLAENGGLDQINTLVELRNQHANGLFAAGLHAETGDVEDMVESGVIEPLAVKTNAISSAQDAATLLIRIDDVIAGLSGGEDDEAGPDGAPGGAPGAPGMPGGMPGGGPAGMPGM